MGKTKLTPKGTKSLVVLLISVFLLGGYLFYVQTLSGTAVGSVELLEGNSISIGRVSLAKTSGSKAATLGPIQLTPKANPLRGNISVSYRKDRIVGISNKALVAGNLQVEDSTGTVVFQAEERIQGSRSSKDKNTRKNVRGQLSFGPFQIKTAGDYTFIASIEDSEDAQIYAASFEVRKNVARMSPVLITPLAGIAILALVFLVFELKNNEKEK